MIKIIVLLLLVVGLVWSLRSLEQRTLYYPIRNFDAVPQTYGLKAEEVWMTAADGRKVNGWFIPALKATHTILLSHGNAGNISHRLDKAKRLNQIGLNVFLYDYAGYGKSEGTPSEKVTYADAEAAYQWVDKKLGAKHIILYGESLGCAVAVELATRHPEVAGLVLESPFTSTIEMAKRVFPWLPAKLLVRNHYDNISKIKTIQTPLLILHSPQDEIVPYEMGQRLYQAATGPKKFVPLMGSHNEGYADSGSHYLQAIRQWIIPS